MLNYYVDMVLVKVEGLIAESKKLNPTNNSTQLDRITKAIR